MAIYPPNKTQKDIDEVYKRAYERTKIIYPKKKTFFSPRLRTLHQISIDKGYLASTLVGIGDFCIDLVAACIAAVKKINRKIFPREDVIHGTKKDSYVTGKITFAKKNDLTTPIHHMQVEFWARTFFGGWRKMSSGHTDEEGVFKLYFDFIEAKKFKYRRSFHFEIHQVEHVFFNQDSGEPRKKVSVFDSFKVKKSDLTGMGYDLGLIQLFYWEYRDDVPIPRVVIKEQNEDAPEYYSEGRNEAAAEQFIPIEIIKDKHLLQIKRNPQSISIESIQDDYPTNLTVAMEREIPGSTRCDYWFGRRMMNGMSCATFLPDEKEKGKYWVKIFGSCDYEVNQEFAFPTVYGQFKIADNGLPLPTKIIVKGQTDAYNKNPFQEKTFTPNDGEKWEQAKRIMRVSSALSSEIDDHFAGTHLNTEQYAIAVRRNVRLNPVAELLLPHLKEVTLINHTADTNLIGPGYIPRASAMTAEGIIERSKDALGTHDWKNWKPMEPISEQHTFAIASNLFWDVVHQFVDYFFDENEEDIKKYWYEIYCMSNDLVNNSVPLFLSEQDSRKWTGEERELNQDRIEYNHLRACFDNTLSRDIINGKKKSISSITKSKNTPAEGDMDNLKDMCKYAIMVATFLHTYVNEHQYEDIGEVLYCSLGLRYGDKEDGIFQPENDYSIAPDLTRATQMMWFSNLLSRTEYGFITRNEEHDIHPYFSKLLLDKKEEFAKLHVNVENIESRTNI